MNKFSLICCLLLLISCNTNKKKQIPITNGVSLPLAELRKKQFDNVEYHLDFKIPETLTATIPSKLNLQLTINQIEDDLILDFNENSENLKKIIVNRISIPLKHEKEHIIIDHEYLQKGKNTLEIDFIAGELSLNRNKEYLYTLLVPDRASTLFPCFDQPDIKANYLLNITAPKDWKVLCGAPLKEKIEKDAFIEHRFNKTDKMSTYLFSFVAGKFQEQIKTMPSFPMRLLYRETNPDKIKESLSPIFDIHQSSLTFLEKYTNYSFPFQKMDFATLPPFQYGGMEHTGAIQYRESKLFLDQNATQSTKLGRAKLIAHETSHMWFGNLVTMRWFNDVWMKEVFANFMADKIMNPVFPEINHRLNFMMSHYPSAYSEDRTKGTNPIRQHLENLKNAGTLYGRIIYNKAPIMMRQLELLLGKEAFQKGIQEYVKTYANDNADWNDLVHIFDKKSTKNIQEWSDVWVNSPGRPIISDSISYKDGKIEKFTIQQEAENGSNKVWAQQFSIGLLYDKEIKTLDIDLNKKSINVEEAIGLPKPHEIIYNYNGLGYGIFPVTPHSHISSIKDDVARGYTFINLYENMLYGEVAPLTAYKIFLSGIAVEKNELITNYLYGRITSIYWKFLHHEQQHKIQPITENILFNLLKKKLPKNIKRTIYHLYSSIAYSNSGKENLYKLWKGLLKIDNLQLNNTDLSSLAMRLALYEHPKTKEILQQQQESITNKDKKERFVWLLPSLSKDEKIRDEFMLSLKDPKNREKESWVEAALSNIHHPLRQKSSIKHLKLCLDLLEEIQLTGDIFFPKRWLANSVGRYSSKEAYLIVQDFLKHSKDYQPTLLKKLLMVVDNLERAQFIAH